MTRKYTHVIWDWNGTLFDDAFLCVDIMNGQLRQRNLPCLTIERYRELFDFPVKVYYDRVGFDFKLESFEVVGTEFICLYERRKFEAGLRSDALKVLDTLQISGVAQAMLSAYKHDTLEVLVDHYHLRDFFSHLKGLDNHYAKGKVENGLDLMHTLGCEPRKTLMVGDTVHDYDVASAMGTDCALVLGGHHPREKLVNCGVPVLESLNELIPMIGV